MRSLLIIGAAGAVLLLFLVRNARDAQATIRAEDAAIERAMALAEGPRGPPRSEGSYRFEWREDGDLPPVVLAWPDGMGVCLFAAAPGGVVYAYELFGAPPPDVTPLRIHLVRGTGAPPGWRKIR